ncbi:unnamed protein product [Diamesa hyperborea]
MIMSESDSPTRRSSIPILKQTNKTKSFQTYVHLNLNDDQQQQNHQKSASSSSNSSVPTSPHQNFEVAPRLPAKPSYMKQHSSLSHTSSVGSHRFEIDNDIVITKLCDENNRLKDHQKQLVGNLQKQQVEYTNVIEKNKKLQKKLEEILPESIKSDYEAVSFQTPINKLENANISTDLQNMMGELEKLKSYLNNVELQLYEANERISDLLEGKQELEEENKNLKTQNAELNNITKLMTANMHETLNTSKKMEETFMRVKNERDELLSSRNRDLTDSGKQTMTVNEEIQSLKTELKRQKAVYEAQFIEYKDAVVEEIQRSVNSEVESLRIRLELMDTELEISKQQTESAEEELRQLKASIRLSAKYTAIDSMPTLTTSLPPPPPPPPPMPLINQTTNIRSRSGSLSLSDAIAAQKLNHQSNGQQQMALSKKATGLDAVIDDLKNGRVTLRRRPKPIATPTSPTDNQLKGIFDLLQKNQRQNRNSKKILDNELASVFKTKFNIDV